MLWRSGHHFDGKAASGRPGVKQAAIGPPRLGGAYRDGFVPPSAINWNDADDNNAFHAKLMVMDVDGTLSTEVAVRTSTPKWYYKDIVTHGLDYRTTMRASPCRASSGSDRPDPGDAENATVAEGIPQAFIQPKISASSSSWVRSLAAGHAVAGQRADGRIRDPHLRVPSSRGSSADVPDYCVFNLAMAESAPSTCGAWR
jgi:hypothetical protein